MSCDIVVYSALGPCRENFYFGTELCRYEDRVPSDVGEARGARDGKIVHSPYRVKDQHETARGQDTGFTS